MNLANIRRILIIRTDKIGDLVLSTPTITAARNAFPDAYIAVMVSDRTKDIVMHNPYVNEVIVYDKRVRHKGVISTLRFAKWLRSKQFDLALILHSTVRVNIVSFLAGIPKRVGYGRGKMDFLLTDKLEYTKRFGDKHEVEYCMDVLRSIGIEAQAPPLFIPIKKSDEESVDGLLAEGRLEQGQRIVVIHPASRSVSKIWPVENFAEIADSLIERFRIRVAIISSPEQIESGEKLREMMKNNAIFLCGRISLGELAALLKMSSLLISNDSGPIHMASAVGIPVVAIFGRKEKGLGPKRWGPLSRDSFVIQKDAGCTDCLAHNCKRDFLCLRSVTVEEVVEKAGIILRRV